MITSRISIVTMAAKVEVEKETISIAVYKANLHCPKCAHDIKKPLMRTPGNVLYIYDGVYNGLMVHVLFLNVLVYVYSINFFVWVSNEFNQ